MKYIYLLFFMSSLSYAGGQDVKTPDYMNIHKSFMSLTCIDEKTQQAMDQCGKKSLENATTQMNSLLNVLKESYSTDEPGLLELLLSSQADWKIYMNSVCKVETYYSRNGSGFDSIWNSCIEMKINERISFLTWMKENP